MHARGVSPVIGVVILIALTLVLGVIVLSFGVPHLSGTTPHASIDGTVDAEENKIRLVHSGGEPLPVDQLRFHVTVDGESLKHHPSYPFSSNTGFVGFPSGAFNPSSSGQWRPGEAGSFVLARTSNGPMPDVDSRVIVQTYVDETLVSEVELSHRR